MSRIGLQEKALPLTVSLARRAWVLSNALVPTIIRQQIFSDGNDARSFAFRANSDFRQSQFQSTRHHSLRKDAAATEMDCAFIVVKARQRSQVDSCSLPPYWVSRLLRTSCRCRVIPPRHLSAISEQDQSAPVRSDSQRSCVHISYRLSEGWLFDICSSDKSAPMNDPRPLLIGGFHPILETGATGFTIRRPFIHGIMSRQDAE